MNLFFKKSHVILEDNPFKLSQYMYGFPQWGFFEFKSRQTYSEFVNTTEISLAERDIYAIFLRTDLSSSRIYKRVIQSMIEYLGDMGGLLDIIFITGTILTALIVKREFESALVREAYSIQKYTTD